MIAPEQIDGQTLFEHAGSADLFRRWRPAPELDDPDHLLMLGHLLKRLHAVGSMHPFKHRPTLDWQSFGRNSVDYLRSAEVVPSSLQPAYFSVAEDLLQVVKERLEAHPAKQIRLHGDLHVGNLLWRDDSLYMVDLDDCRMGPAVQDLWMMLSGERDRQAQLSELIDGYNEFHDFNPAELALIEPLRSLRLVHYSAWLARLGGPGVPMHFPWFAQERYWADQILTLREQRAALNEPALRLF